MDRHRRNTRLMQIQVQSWSRKLIR